MRRYTYGYVLLALALLGAPACSGSGDATSATNRRDSAATERAVHQTNETAPDTSRTAGATAPEQRSTGTSGSMVRGTEEAMGLGPDAAITMRIQAKYADDDVVKGRNIDVDTENGVVTLKGRVDSLHERDAAEQLARETEGVKRVVNDLKVASR